MPATDTEDLVASARELVGEDEAPETLKSAVDEQLDDLEIQVEAREWKVAGEIIARNPRTQQDESMPFERTYTQKPLSYTAMLQFTGLVGDRISTVMGQGVTLDSVLGDAQMIVGAFQDGATGISRSDFAGVDSFVMGLAKLISFLPDMIEVCQCIWLRVPLHERPLVSEIWSRSPEDGGLSMDDGEEMMNLFIAQNYQELEDFFVVRLPRTLRLTQAARTKRSRGAGDRQPLRPSSTSQPITRSQ